MMQSEARPSIFSNPIGKLKNYSPYLALLLGASFGLLFYSYWLVDHFPPISKQTIFYAILAGLVAATCYYLILELYIGPLISQAAKGATWGFLIGSVVIGAYLAFTYSNSQETPSRNIPFLLPEQSLSISVPDQQDTAGGQIAVIRFSTSLGDISYNALHTQGWIRKGNDLVLSDPSKNLLEWTGRAGEEATLTFRVPQAAQTVINVSWNGATQTVKTIAGADERYELPHRFAIPFYASAMMLLLLAAVNFMVLCLAVNLLLWNKRSEILTGLEQSVSNLFHPNGGAEASRRQPIGREVPVIACLVVLALLLRAFNLGNLYPYADEYSHLLAAKALLQGAAWNSVFDRSLFIVTLPVVVSLRLLGNELWAARLPGVFFNALGIIPLYLLMRKINKPVAVLSALLYASSPLIIGVARNVREYAYYPFYFYWIVYMMVLFLERLPDKLILFRDWKQLFRPDTRLLTLALMLPPVYAVFLDARSTFKIIMIAYAVLGLFMLGKSDLKNRANVIFLGILGTGLLVAGAAYAADFGHSALSVAPKFHTDALAIFFPNPMQQWYFDRPAVVPAIALLAATLLCFRTARSNLVPSFLAALLLASAVFFTTFFGHYLKPRYLTIMELWYIGFLALGLYGLFAFQLRFPRKEVIMPLLTTAMFALTINVPQSLLPTVYDKQGNMPITTEYHFNLGPANAFLLDKVSDQDALISSMYGGYALWKGIPRFKEIYSYGFTLYSLQHKGIIPYEAAEVLPVKPHDYILSLVAKDSSGWIVLDSITYASTLERPMSQKMTLINNKQIDYVGYFGGEYIWRWHTLPPAP